MRNRKQEIDSQDNNSIESNNHQCGGKNAKEKDRNNEKEDKDMSNENRNTAGAEKEKIHPKHKEKAKHTGNSKQKIKELEQKIKELEQEIEEEKDRNLRLRAEFENYRKRVYKDIETTRIMTMEDTVMPFLNIYDVFNMAMKASETSDNLDALKQGLNMILQEFKKTMDELGITEIDATGKKFDPDLHEAVDKKETDEHEEGTVIQQWRKGYKLGDRVIRPATVVVSMKPDSSKAEK